MLQNWLRIPLFGLLAFFIIPACNGSGENSDLANARDLQTTPSAKIPSGAVEITTDPLVLALKYVVYKDTSGVPSLTKEQAEANVSGINERWKQCKISFQLETHLPISPAEYDLRYQTAHYSELTDIREIFSDEKSLLIVSTGTWDRTGSLGNTGANAWTSMPNSPPHGIIIERPVNLNINLLAHELGHYLNLGHTNNTTTLMNPIIYRRSTQLSSTECESARAAALYFWPRMLR